MDTNNPFSNFFSDTEFTKLMQQYQETPFDMKTIMEAQRKNVQAMTEAQQLAMEGMQAIAQRQSEIISQMVEDQSKMAQEMMGEGTPEEKISRNADLFKKTYERTIGNVRELADMLSKSNTQATDIINKRISDSMSEIKSALDKKTKKAA